MTPDQLLSKPVIAWLNEYEKKSPYKSSAEADKDFSVWFLANQDIINKDIESKYLNLFDTDKEKYWEKYLQCVNDHINLDCDSFHYVWNRKYKGSIIADDPSEEVLDFVKDNLQYEELEKAGRTHEITIDSSWPFGDINLCWRKMVSGIIDSPKSHHSLIVVNICDVRMFGLCWCLKHLSMQNNLEHIFDGYVLIVLKGFTWDDAEKYAMANNPEDYKSMMDYYRIINIAEKDRC